MFTSSSPTSNFHLLNAQLFLISLFTCMSSAEVWKTSVKCLTVFDHIKQRDHQSWNMIISAYRRHGYPQETVTLFHQMQQTDLQPDQFRFATVLPALAKMGALKEDMDIHQRLKDKGILSDIVVATAMVNMHAKCGSIDKASELFDKMTRRKVFSWNAMIAVYAQNGLVEKDLKTFRQMQSAGVKPDCATFVSILPACAKMGALEQGVHIHQSIKDRKFLSDVVVATALVDMYAKCGSIDKTHELFDKMTPRNVISWNTMIATFKQMQLAGVIASILPACAKWELWNRLWTFIKE